MFCLILLICLLPLSLCKSFYDVLGVGIYADSKEIKKAYYQLALTLHPDKIKNPTEEDKNRYMEIVKAYETLSDPEKKRLYDLSGGDDDDDVIITNLYTDQFFEFKSFSPNYRFEAHYTPHSVSQAPPIILSFSISIEELFTGISHRILQYNRTSICSVCNGTGSDSPSHIHVCDGCQGSGFRQYPSLFSSHTGLSYTTQCDICYGSGFHPQPNHQCSYCHGTGLLTIEDFVDFSLQPGIRSTHQSVHRGLGHEAFQRKRGDVIVKLHVLPDPLFDVDDYNLHMNITLSIAEALFGFEKNVHLPSNQTVLVKKTTRTADGSVLILQNHGIPLGKSGIRGSLYIHFFILYPYFLTEDEQVQIVRQFGEESEEIVDFIQYHAEKRLQKDSNDLHYPLSKEEFFYSSQSSYDRTCLFSLFSV